MILRRLISLVALAAAIAMPALAEKRVALVIGNSAYVHAPVLPNPKHDAEGMAAALKRLDFEVLAGTDLAKPAMDKLLQAFADKLEKADVALVFYAGHGLQVGGHNYLVPIDGKLDKESDLVFQAVSLDTIQGLMEQSQRTNIMILDACRDNPLARNLARSMGTRSTGIGRGLGETKAGIGTLIVYATQPGNVALDGEGANSPFTAALLAHLETKGLEVRQVLTRVRQAVIANTKGKQVPWDSSSLTGDFFFAAAPGAVAPPPSPSPPASREPAQSDEHLFWQSIKDSKNAADYKAYLAKYPQGTFAELAKIRLAEIEKTAVVTPHVPGKPEMRPAAPVAPKRTSTYESGIHFTGRNEVGGSSWMVNVNVPTPQACASLCLRRPECLYWTYNTEAMPLESARRYCFLLTSMTKREREPWSVSGVIRTTPATASAQPRAAPAPTPTRTPALDGTTYSGESFPVAWIAGGPEDCAALCAKNSQCVAWNYQRKEPGPYACLLMKSVNGRETGKSGWTSGVVHR
jgi:uncharacterized caspase-like protein